MIVFMRQPLTFRWQGMFAMRARPDLAIHDFVRVLRQGPRHTLASLATLLASRLKPVRLLPLRRRQAGVVRCLRRPFQLRQTLLEPRVLRTQRRVLGFQRPNFRFKRLNARKYPNQQVDQGRLVQRIKLMAIHEELESITFPHVNPLPTTHTNRRR
jgi:hypothetical protein